MLVVLTVLVSAGPVNYSCSLIFVFKHSKLVGGGKNECN